MLLQEVKCIAGYTEFSLLATVLGRRRALTPKATTGVEKRGMALLSSPLPQDSPKATVDMCDACHEAGAGAEGEKQRMGLFTDASLKSNGIMPTAEDAGLQDQTGSDEEGVR